MYFDKDVGRGYNPYLTRGVDDQNTNMDIGLLVLDEGDTWESDEKNDELQYERFGFVRIESKDSKGIRAVFSHR